MRKLFLYTVLLTAAVLTSCRGRIVFDKYDHTPIAGWEKNDTLLFDVPPLENSGYYSGELGLRINGAYPFTGLMMIVERRILPEKREVVDTINCKLADERNGRPLGQGVSYYQYNFPLKEIRLNKGDSLHIVIRHNMRREILPGISDVGISIKKEG